MDPLVEIPPGKVDYDLETFVSSVTPKCCGIVRTAFKKEKKKKKCVISSL